MTALPNNLVRKITVSLGQAGRLFFMFMILTINAISDMTHDTIAQRAVIPAVIQLKNKSHVIIACSPPFPLTVVPLKSTGKQNIIVLSTSHKATTHNSHFFLVSVLDKYWYA